MTHTATITPVNATTPQELIDLVRQASASRTPIVDYGRSHHGLGNPPPASHYLLTQAGEGSGIIDHYDRDMTVRVAGGATLGQVQQALKASNQFVPLDADPDFSFTEIITTNTQGPLRLAYGGPRDLLLGLHYIDGQARNIQVGGRTVKNVAGLDVTRLMVGSLGELGIIHQATLRTYAIPEHVLSVDVRIDDPARLGSFLTDWIITDASPVWMTLEHTDAFWRIGLAYHGRASACAAQLRSLQGMIESLGGMHVVGTSPGRFEDDMASHQARRAWQRSAVALVKLVVPPASTGQAMKDLQAFNQSLGGRLNAMANPAHGLIHAGGDLSADEARQFDALVKRIIATHQGLRVWILRPAGSEGDISPFDPIPSEMPVFRRLKDTMDPFHLFNPGRCITQEQPQQ